MTIPIAMHKNSIPRCRLLITLFALSAIGWYVLLSNVLAEGPMKGLATSVEEWGAISDDGIDDSAALQEAFDSGQHLYLPRGTYDITKTLRLTASGQRIEGESQTSSILWMRKTGVDAIHIAHHSNENIPNAPGAIKESSQWGVLSNFTIIYNGGGKNTASAIKTLPRPGTGTDWNAEAWSVIRVKFQGFHKGMDIRYASKFQTINCYAKDCHIGYHFWGATDNCPRVETVSAFNCDIGMKIENGRGISMSLGDFAECDTGIIAIGTTGIFTGGRLESWALDSHFLDITSSRVAMKGGNFHGASSPVINRGRGCLTLEANVWIRQGQPKAPISAFGISDNPNAIIIGNNADSWLFGNISNGEYIDNWIRCADGKTRQLSWVPWVYYNTTAPIREMEGLQQHEFHNGRDGGDSVIFLSDPDGKVRKSYLNRPNLRKFTYPGGVSGVKGWESYIRKAGGQLLIPTPKNIWLTRDMAVKIDIYNSSDRENLVLTRWGVTTLNGKGRNIAIKPRGSATMMTDGGNDWMVRVFN